MKILAGRMRGMRLRSSLPSSGRHTVRPTTSRIRATVFDILTNGRHGNLVADARVLDLFAGTGAMGLEAISRGAAGVTFVELNMKTADIVRRNIEITGQQAHARVLRMDARSLTVANACRHDLVLVDPPYASGLEMPALERALDTGWIGTGSWIVLENSSEFQGTEWFERADARTIGSTVITIGRVM